MSGSWIAGLRTWMAVLVLAMVHLTAILVLAQSASSVTVNGLKPGMYRNQVHKRLGPPRKSDSTEEHYQGLDIRYGPSGSVVELRGSTLEVEGEVVLSAGETREKALQVLAQAFGPASPDRDVVHYENLPFKVHVRFEDERVRCISMGRKN
ncbi:MAG: hypothetical protein HY319_32825 [Armatimonadetes bacterium]|nr:hypothetical protein [Armatimonadota bacterium]